jgi:hypothetical protein
MPKLSKFAANAKVGDAIRWYMPNWNGDAVPYVDVRPATADNPKWISARIAWEKSPEGQRLTKGQGVTAGKNDAIREVDYRMFADLLIVGWGNIVDDDGVEVKFDAAKPRETEAVLREFGNYNFDDLRQTARQPERGERVQGTRELAGNS